jgi:hypothetical protein
MTQRFAIRLVIPVGMMGAVLVLPGVATFAQQTDSSSQPRAQQVTPSGRAQGGSSVQAAQSSSGNGANSSVNTVNSTIQVSGAFQGSIPDQNAPQGPLTLNIEDAIRRGLRFNLGPISANASVKQLRGERLAALSMMLPNIYGTLSENGAKIDLGTQGLSPGAFGPTLPLPTTIGPFHYYSAPANVSEIFSMTSLGNLRQSQASAKAAETSAQDARELIVLAVGGTYLQVLASKANVLSQEAQVKQAHVTFTQTDHQFQAGTKASIDRNKSLVEFNTEQQRLSSLRADLVKQTMQLARLIGLPVSQVVTLSDELPARVPEAVSLEEALKLALQERSDLKAARLQVKLAKRRRRSISRPSASPAITGLRESTPTRELPFFRPQPQSPSRYSRAAECKPISNRPMPLSANERRNTTMKRVWSNLTYAKPTSI